MTDEARKEFLERVIPSRMREIAFCGIVCRIVNQQAVRKELQVQPATLTLGMQGIGHADQRVFVNPVLTSGVVFCRVMLEFLGIKWSSADGLYPRKDKRSDDVMCETFDVVPISMVDFHAEVGSAIPPVGEQSVAAVVRAANKGVAHMTEPIERSIGIHHLGYTCGLTNHPINAHFFRKLGMTEVELPTFKLPG